MNGTPHLSFNPKYFFITSSERYLHKRDLVPAGNSTNPVISSYFLRCGPALTLFPNFAGAELPLAGAAALAVAATGAG